MIRLKIIHVCPRYYPYRGGVERVVKNLAEELATQNHEVTVYATDPSNMLPQQRVVNGVTVKNYYALAPEENYHLPHPRMLMHLLREQGDIIHAHSVHDLTILVAQATHRLNVNTRFIVSPYYHGGGHTRLTSMLWAPFRVVMRRALQEADAIIVNSKTLKDEMERTFKPTCRISVVYDGVDSDKIKDAEPFDYDEKSTVLLYVGRLEEYKNIHVTIASMKYLPANYHFYIIGQGPFKPSLESLVQSLGLGNRVHLLGFQPDHIVYRWLKTAHVFMHLSAVESFGMTCIEALAAGTPTVANDDGLGLRETISLYPEDIVMHNVREQSSSELAELIMKAAELKPVNADVSRFSWKHIVGSVVSIYDQIA